MNRTRTRRLSATATVVACIALVVAACGGGDSATDDSTPAGTSPTSDTAASVDGGPVTDAPTATDGDETTDEPASGDAPPVSEGQLEEDVVDEPTDPVAGGTVRFGIEADVDGLNPTGSALSAPDAPVDHSSGGRLPSTQTFPRRGIEAGS